MYEWPDRRAAPRHDRDWVTLVMGCTGCFPQQVRLSLVSPAYRRSSIAKVEFDDLMSVGIDICKGTFHIVGFDHDGQRVSYW